MELKLKNINEQDLLNARFRHSKYKSFEKRKILYYGKMGEKQIPLVFAIIIVDLEDNNIKINVVDENEKDYIPFYNTKYVNKNSVADEVKQNYAKEIGYLIKDGICFLKEKYTNIDTLKEIILWEINGISFKVGDTISIKGKIYGNYFKGNVLLEKIDKSKMKIVFKDKGILKTIEFKDIQKLAKAL